jgi:hypothetical protein
MEERERRKKEGAKEEVPRALVGEPHSFAPFDCSACQALALGGTARGWASRAIVAPQASDAGAEPCRDTVTYSLEGRTEVVRPVRRKASSVPEPGRTGKLGCKTWSRKDLLR